MKALNLTARILTAIALLVNAYVHFRLAPTFDALTGSLLSLGDLFRIQGVAGIIVAVLMVALSRRWVTVVATGLAFAGIAMLVISVYSPLDLSAIGLPVISESAWYPDKLITLAAQGLAMITALLAALSMSPRAATTEKS